MAHFVRYHLPFILYCLLILTLSSIPNLTPPLLEFEMKDKLSHLLEYTVLGWLFMRSAAHRDIDAPAGRILMVAVLWGALFGMLDELYQSFIPNRFSDVADAAADALGALIGTLVYWALSMRGTRPGHQPAGGVWTKEESGKQH